MGLGEVCMNLVYSGGSQCVGCVTVREERVGMGRTFGKVYKKLVTWCML